MMVIRRIYEYILSVLIYIFIFASFNSLVDSQFSGLTQISDPKESIIVRKLSIKNICNLKGLDENLYNCQYLGDNSNIAFIEFDCETFRSQNTPLFLFSECNSIVKLSDDLFSLNECKRNYCDAVDGPLSLLVVRSTNKDEYLNAYQMFQRRFRFKESIRDMKLSPTSLHLAYKKRVSILNLERKSEILSSPFLNKYIVYYIGSEEYVPTLDWILSVFKGSLFNKYLDLKDEFELEAIDENISVGMVLVEFTWTLASIMELYWSRGVVDSSKFNNVTSSFDEGLSYRVHCTLDFSSFLLNLKPFYDYLLHMSESSNTEASIKNYGEENIKNMFSFLKLDIDSFYLMPSIYEINSENSKDEDLFDRSFPCMSKYKSRKKIKKTSIQVYSNEIRHKENLDLFDLGKGIHEDIYSLVNIIHSILSKFLLSLLPEDKLVNLNQRMDKYKETMDNSYDVILNYYNLFSKLLLRITELKNEVELNCGLRTFKSRKRSKNNNFESCSIRYSLKVIQKLDRIYLSIFLDSGKISGLRRIRHHSTEYLMKSTYCFFKSFIKNKYDNIPNELVVKTAFPYSLIYNFQYQDANSIKSDCLHNLKKSLISRFINPESNDSICKNFSSCMFEKDSMNIAFDFVQKLRDIDLNGGFKEKSMLIKNMCEHSNIVFYLNSKSRSSESRNNDFIDCTSYRLLLLSYRTSLLLPRIMESKYKINLYSKSGISYFISDSSIANYLLINDFCTDPEVSALIQCDFDFSNEEETSKTKKYNYIVLQDGTTVFTPLYFKEPTDSDFTRLMNGILFARIIDTINSNTRLMYFNGLPFPYYLDNNELMYNSSESANKYSYFTKHSNKQKVLALKLTFISSPVAFVLRDNFDTVTLIRNWKQFKEKFSIPDISGLFVPLTPAVIQIESMNSNNGSSNSVLYPYIMIQEFINPLHIDKFIDNNAKMEIKKQEKDFVSLNQLNSENGINKHQENYMRNIKYPTDIVLVISKIIEAEPLILNLIVTGRGYEYLKLILKASYLIGYYVLTAIVSFWVGGTRFRQHCDLHGRNILTRFPSHWLDDNWEDYVKKIIKYSNLNHFSLIDLDFSYESEMKISNVLEDLENLPDKDPCHHPSVLENNSQVSSNDYQNYIGEICESHLSLSSFSEVISENYPSKSIYSDFSSEYINLMIIHNATLSFCNETKDKIEQLSNTNELNLFEGYKLFQKLRKATWNSILILNNLDRDHKYDTNLFNRMLFTNLEISDIQTADHKEIGNLRTHKKEINLEYSERISPTFLPSITKHTVLFYCTSESTKGVVDDPSLKFTDLINFLIQRSSLENYIRRVYFGSSFENFEVMRNKLESIHNEYSNCISDPNINNIVKELLGLLKDNPDTICPSKICTDLTRLNIFESMISVYRYHYDILMSLIYSLNGSINEQLKFIDLKIFMVKTDYQTNSSHLEPLNLSLQQIRAIIELNNFCNRDNQYTILKYSNEVYSNIKCKLIPKFEKYGSKTNGALILKVITKAESENYSITFPWIYNSDFTIFGSHFNFKDIDGITVIGMLPRHENKHKKNEKKDSIPKEIFIHKNDRSIYEYTTHLQKYQVPPTLIEKVSLLSYKLYRNNFLNYSNVHLNSLTAFSIQKSDMNFYKWLNRIQTKLNNPLFDDIPKHKQREIIILIGLIVKTFKSLWVPTLKCRYNGTETICVPMFCGISSQNIVLKVGEDYKVKNIKILSAHNLKIVNSHLVNFVQDKKISDSSISESMLPDYSKISNHILPFKCDNKNSHANDMVTIASTLEYLLFCILMNRNLDPNKMFSSNILDIYYRYSEMSFEELLEQINDYCQRLTVYLNLNAKLC